MSYGPTPYGTFAALGAYGAAAPTVSQCKKAKENFDSAKKKHIAPGMVAALGILVNCPEYIVDKKKRTVTANPRVSRGTVGKVISQGRRRDEVVLHDGTIVKRKDAIKTALENGVPYEQLVKTDSTGKPPTAESVAHWAKYDKDVAALQSKYSPGNVAGEMARVAAQDAPPSRKGPILAGIGISIVAIAIGSFFILRKKKV